MGEYNSILLDEDDNVVTSLKLIEIGEDITSIELANTFPSKQTIKKGHKVAKDFIPKGSIVVKYGKPIGIALIDILPGELVHLHNIKSRRGKELWEADKNG